MLTAPYSIYVNKRPVRIAFLVEDKPESLAIIDAILADNRNRWGGRYNPIIITDGQSLTDDWWAFLEAVDPDIVKSFVTLSDNLVANIDRRISPLLIQQPDRNEKENGFRSLNLHNPSVSILPTKSNIKMASWGIRESSLVLFESNSEKIDPQIRQFIRWNFGEYSPPGDAVNRVLAGVVFTEYYSVNDAVSLVNSLIALSSFRTFTYPIQLCSIPKEALPQVDYDRLNEMFHVVIGDTPADLAYFWNRPSTIPQQNRTYLNQIWLPLCIATNPQLVPVLSSWLQRSADPTGTGQGNIRFVSLSLSQEKLQEIIKPLTCNLAVRSYVEALQKIQPPKISNGNTRPSNKSEMDLYRASSSEERLTLQEPDILQGSVLNEYWMDDFYIEFRPERNPTRNEHQFWWQLPRLNDLAMCIFKRPSRILRTRYPSVLMMRGTPRLSIVFPDDLQIFKMLACLPNQMHDLIDARHNKILSGRAPFYQAQRSDKGRYLSGLLELFGGLDQARFILMERYWRCIFDLLSGRPAPKESQQLEVIENKLRKNLTNNPPQFYQDDKELKWIAHYVLEFAHNLPTSSRDLNFHIFEEYAKKEMDDFNASHASETPSAYSQKDLIEAMGGLTERGILLMGIHAKCPSCGYQAWHHIDDTTQTLSCGGCNSSFPMKPESIWYYRLNSLVRAAYAEHGLLPVVLVLGQLLMHAESAFLFAPCLDLFENVDDSPIGDLDIALILNGKFVIGEIKQKRDHFDKASFDKIEKIAYRLLPDVVLFASMDREPTELIKREITRLSEALRPLCIKVSWYSLEDYTFDPAPVM
jgi:hypothetical protein